MASKEDFRIREIDQQLVKLKHTHKAFLPVHQQLDRKLKGIELSIKLLEDERVKLANGQLVFDGAYDF